MLSTISGSLEYIYKVCVLQACQTLDPKQKFLCNDHEGRISYLSTQQATQPDVAALVRQACIRSLSCEVRIQQSHFAMWMPEFLEFIMPKNCASFI
jgi:hypothetical protein